LVVAAFAGCVGVFHVATPVPEQKMVDPQASACTFLWSWLLWEYFPSYIFPECILMCFCTFPFSKGKIFQS
jgi:hypothetical protein